MSMEKELRILMLEDLEEDAGLLDRVLFKEKIPFTRKRVETKEEFIRELGSFEPELILSDHALPQFNSIEALKIAQELKPGTPFIIVTGSVSEEFAVGCIKRGANDYILKSNLSRLPLAIRYALNEQEGKKIRKQQEDILRRQNSELTKFNKELDSFVYNISHNLRSPLATVIGLVNVARLDETKSNQTTDQYFEMIRKSTLKLDDTLKEIFDYSQNLRTDLEISEIDLQSVCDRVFLKLDRLRGSEGIKKEINIPSRPGFYSDVSRIEIILTHLFSNCIKYKDVNKGQHIIKIDAVITATQAELTIWDNGVGIHADYIGDIFKMFVRTNETSDGSGLGLFVVKEVIEKLNGSIEVSSTYGEWTQIRIILPNRAK